MSALHSDDGDPDRVRDRHHRYQADNRDQLDHEEIAMTTLGEALPKEIARVRELLPLYDAIPTGALAARMMRIDLDAATRALAEGDLPGMISCFEKLKGYSA